jgi:threonine dehydratase
LLDCEVLLKGEHQLPTGSFKLRGATNKLRLLGEGARSLGVLTASTGNHGQAVALAGRRRGVPVTVYVSAETAPAKMAAIRALGAVLAVVDGPPIEAELAARRRASADGVPYISPYNDLDVIAGQGTLGVELAEQMPELDAVFIAVGGGGLVAGAGTALKALSPRTRVIGAWPENSPCMKRALEAGEIVEVPEKPTLSDGTAGAVEHGSVTFPLCQAVIDETVEVSESAIAEAMRQVAEHERWMVEGAAGVALAGLSARADAYRGGTVAVVLCGRNIALHKFLAAVASAGARG